MVDYHYTNAAVHLNPSPIPPSGAMTTVPVFADHNTTVRAQRNGVNRVRMAFERSQALTGSYLPKP